MRRQGYELKVDYYTIPNAKYPRIRIRGFLFTASVDVTPKATKWTHRTTKDGELLWALPGGGEATEAVIRLLMRDPKGD